MPPPDPAAELHQHDLPGRVAFGPGQGGLERALVTTPWSKAEVYRHGAQVTGFQNADGPPLLYLSERSVFAPGRAIRGGIPICFPWFGPRSEDMAHGFARVTEWKVTNTAARADGSVVLRFALRAPPARRTWPPFSAELVVTIARHLNLELIVTNPALDQAFEFEACFHTYFHVGDIDSISIFGLPQLARAASEAATRGPAKPLQIHGHFDHTYLDAHGPVEIFDPRLQRRIRIEKSGSSSTVVWNPWTTQVLSDLGPEEYRRMVCVESGNVGRNRVRLAPGQRASLSVTLGAEPLSRS